MASLRVVVACGWAVVLLGVSFYIYNGGTFFHDVQHIVNAAPKYSFAVFLAAYAARPLLLVPDSVMLIVGSITFGPWVGFIGGYLGENMSAFIAFFLSRFLGRKWVSHTHAAFVRKLDKVVTRRGALTLTLLRLIPVAPFDAINYGAGLTSMSFKTFALGTVFGVIPALIVYVLLGSAFTDPRLAIPALVILVFIAIKLVALRSLAPDIFSLGLHHHTKQR